MKLRSYQLEIVDKILSNPKSSDLIQLATGGGKTVIAGQICNTFLSKGKKVLFLAHREELISQPKEKLFSQFGIDSSIIMAKHKSDLETPMQIASVQTFNRRLNFEPNVIIIDEAHHSTAATYQRVIKAYPNAKLIGLTATPYRLSGKGFKDTFQNLITSRTVKQLENEGFLVPAKCYSYPIGHDKLSRIKITGGDYNEQELEELMLDRVLIEDIVVSYEAHAKGKKMIVFASTVSHSKAICQRLNEMGIKSLHVDANSKNRSEIINEFRYGQFNVLCNVGIATEGVDIPEIKAVCLARPTKSLALYLQMAGRGARPFDSKSEYLLLDHSDNFFHHGAPNKEHEWERFFKGKSKSNIKDTTDDRREFELIFEDGNRLIINSITDIPLEIKGFVLCECNNKKGQKIKKSTCDYCKNSFIANANRNTFCSKDCYVKWIEIKKKEKQERLNDVNIETQCANCGDCFIKNSRRHKYCSDYCRQVKHYEDKGDTLNYRYIALKNNPMRKEDTKTKNLIANMKHVCPVCNADFYKNRPNQKFCSDSCRVANWVKNSDKKEHNSRKIRSEKKQIDRSSTISNIAKKIKNVDNDTLIKILSIINN